MRDLTHNFQIIPLGIIKSQYQDQIELKEGCSVLNFFASSKLSLEQSSDQSEKGLTYSISIKAVLKDCRIDLCNNKEGVISLTTTESKPIIIGDLENPVRFIVTPKASNTYELNIEYITKKSVKI